VSADSPTVEIAVDGDDLLVTGEGISTDRRSRLFFKSVLGASPIADGWRCARRLGTVGSLVVRVNTFLESAGYAVVRGGVADREVQREIERRRSFLRTRGAAQAFKEGRAGVDVAAVKGQLDTFGWLPSRVLRPHQEQGVAHAISVGNAANFAVPGSGKTAVALAVATTHLASATIDLVVVIGPLSCFAPWERETDLALGERLPTYRVRGPALRRRALYGSVKSRSLLLLSYATAASDKTALIELCKTHDVMLIVDESHRIKRFRGGLWAPALIQIAKHARVRMILSGTPMPESGRDLYSQLNVLWPGGELTGPRDSFAARAETQFGTVLRDVSPFISRVGKDALGLRPYEVYRRDVPLLGTQAEIYELIFSRFRRRVEAASTWADKLDALRRARPIRLLQAASNPDLFNRHDMFYRLPRVQADNPTLMDRLATFGSHETPAKSEAALRLIAEIAEAREKVVCWSNFVGNLDDFSELVRRRLGVPCFQIDGRVPAGDEPTDDIGSGLRRNPEDVDTRERIIDRFLDESGAAVLVTNPASCSESISLHRSCHNAIYLDRTYDCAQFLQSIDRIHRLGLAPDTVVRVYVLRATLNDEPTIDHLVDASLSGKETVMRELLEGAELRPMALSSDPADDAEGTSEDVGALLRYLLGEQDDTASSE
jgi:SNF2 family DNA or RNA helicase